MAGRISVVRTAALTVLVGACATAVAAQDQPQFKLDPNAPVGVAADRTDYTQDSCTLVLTGNVQITQKQARLVGHVANAVAAKKAGKCADMDRIDVDKDVYYVTPEETVRADHALYDLTGNKVTFTGQVVTVRGADVATGSRLVVDLKTNVYTMEGPVRAVITPPPKKDPNAASATKPAPSPAKLGK